MQDFQEKDFIVICPQCNDPVWILQINCQIFRHAAYKVNGEQIPPHTSQSECEQLVQKEIIYGCGKPFRIVYDSDRKIAAVKCDYI